MFYVSLQLEGTGRIFPRNYRIHPKYNSEKLFSLAFFSNCATEQVLIWFLNNFIFLSYYLLFLQKAIDEIKV